MIKHKAYRLSTTSKLNLLNDLEGVLIDYALSMPSCQDYVMLSHIVLFCKPNRKISQASLARLAQWGLGTVSKHYGMNKRKTHLANEFAKLCRSE